MTTFVISIVASALVGAGLTELVRITDRWWTTRKSEMNGEWLEVLPAWKGEPTREDQLLIRQGDHLLDVQVRRLSPDRERGREWSMRGYVRGNVLVAMFWTKMPKTHASSYGVIVLHRDIEEKDAAWVGRYIRPDRESFETTRDGKNDHRPIEWKRQSS
jgi:hypothetical protein